MHRFRSRLGLSQLLHSSSTSELPTSDSERTKGIDSIVVRHAKQYRAIRPDISIDRNLLPDGLVAFERRGQQLRRT